ncbi:uncharacterized protein LOC135367562 [Ornithodoros turicata]|uniref:uncharacterized protein LOC135367562 n=1 Tax=Ornithodoros turicata TaxID=34597 RepID=UPI0031387462
MKRETLLRLSLLALVPLLAIEARTLPSKDDSARALEASSRMGMLSRFEPIISNMVVPLLVATGVVSLARMVPSVVSQIPNVFGFAKRHGYTELPREVYELMQMLDNANVKYEVNTNQRYPQYQHQNYKVPVHQQAQRQHG